MQGRDVHPTSLPNAYGGGFRNFRDIEQASQRMQACASRGKVEMWHSLELWTELLLAPAPMEQYNRCHFLE